MKFNDFIQVTKKLKLTPKEYRVVDSITREYIKKYQSASDAELNKISVKLPRRIFSRIFLNAADKKLTPKYIHIGTYSVVERKDKQSKDIEVFLIVNAPSTVSEGVYNDGTGEIFLFHDILKRYFKQDIFTVVSHEIVHSVQHYKTTSDRYQEEVVKEEPGEDYYLEPIETEAIISSVVNSLYNTSEEYKRLAKKYLKLQDFDLVKLYNAKHEKFLNSVLNFAKTPLVKFNELTKANTPQVIFDKLGFFKALNTQPGKAKKYKITLYKAVEHMRNDFSTALQKTT